MRERPSPIGIVFEAVVIVAVAAMYGIMLAPVVAPTPEVLNVARWPWLVWTTFCAWFFARVLLPDAWHYRREDKAGLIFILILVSVSLYGVWELVAW